MSGLLVWLGASQSVLINGQSVVAQASGTVSLSGTPAVSLAQTSVVAQVSGTVSLSGTPAITGTVSVSALTTVVSGTVTGLDVARTQVLIVVTGSAVAGGTTMAFTIYQGASQSLAGTSAWTVPAGKVFRVLNVQLIAQNSITTTPVDHELAVLVSAAAPTWTSACPRVAQVMVNAASQTISYSACAVGIADVAPGVTVAIGYSNGATGTLVRAFINGYLFP
jgi:hypothetical protein